MSITEPNGSSQDGSEFVAEKTGETLPTETEKELAELIKIHKEKLLQIAEVFQIDTSKFSVERDKQIAEFITTIGQNAKFINYFAKELTEESITICPDEDPTQESQIARIFPVNISLGYERNSPDIIREFGYIAGPYHENGFNELFEMESGKLNYTSKEYDVLKDYFELTKAGGYCDIKAKAVGLARLVELERISQNKPFVEKFLHYLDTTNRKRNIKAGSAAQNEYEAFIKSEGLSDGEFEQFTQEIDYIVGENYATFDPAVKELNSMLGRMIIELSMIGSQRRDYIPNLVNTDPVFKPLGVDSKTSQRLYSVDDDFTFPEDKTQAAAEYYNQRLAAIGLSPII